MDCLTPVGARTLTRRRREERGKTPARSCRWPCVWLSRRAMFLSNQPHGDRPNQPRMPGRRPYRAPPSRRATASGHDVPRRPTVLPKTILTRARSHCQRRTGFPARRQRPDGLGRPSYNTRTAQTQPGQPTLPARRHPNLPNPPSRARIGVTTSPSARFQTWQDSALASAPAHRGTTGAAHLEDDSLVPGCPRPRCAFPWDRMRDCTTRHAHLRSIQATSNHPSESR